MLIFIILINVSVAIQTLSSNMTEFQVSWLKLVYSKLYFIYFLVISFVFNISFSFSQVIICARVVKWSVIEVSNTRGIYLLSSLILSNINI